MENNTKHNLRKNFYKWHRVIGLIALIPVICWTLSGLSHPLMSNWFRPNIEQEVFKLSTQDQLKPKLSVQQVLALNHIAQLRNFSLVNFNKGTYYQVLLKDSSYNYYSANDGKLLPNGDKAYAVYLTRFFTQDSASTIKTVALQKTFDSRYQPINHLLPVWKVILNRPDGMSVYVETGQSRMATFNNNTRRAFLWFFEQLHTWQFVADLGGERFRLVFLICVVSVMFLSLVTGLTVYGLLWRRFKDITAKRKAEDKEDKRFVHRFHRQLGLIVSFVMLAFVISGAFHLLVKLHNIRPESKPFSQLIDAKDLTVSNLMLPVADSLVKRVSLTKFNNNTYYQVLQKKSRQSYFNVKTGVELKDGDQLFAVSLAAYYQGLNGEHKLIKPDSVTLIRQFNNDYGFNNKRLPVEQVSTGNENWYIETATAKLSAKTAGIDRAEGLSFIFLHKYFGMTWAGKNIRDVVSMLAALGVLVVSLFGFAAFIKNK